SAPMLAKLLEKRGVLPVDLVRSDATRLPFAERRFDAAVGVHVFHLITDWRAALAALAGLLRPDGLLLHGGDDHSRGAAWRRWRDRVEDCGSVPNVGVPRDKIESFPEEEGWQPAGVHRIQFGRRLRPRTMLELVSGRSWSMTWRMDDADLARAVEALRADLVEVYGDLDREVEIDTGFWVRSYRPPPRAPDR